MDARGKFGEHEKCARVARGAAEGNSSFLSAVQTSSMSKFFQSDNKDLLELLYRIECKILTTHQKKKRKHLSLLAGQKHATF